MPEHRPPNRLVNETSPYLLQHAHNPVDWFTWGPEALARARAEDKPILLSIGYSACHWCHVMEHESFEDEQVARLMNELFVCIKVDREERPDLDQIYQLVHQLLNRRGGGWPLTVFLTPVEHTPMFAGTYFPKQARYGMPGFPDVLRRVADHYRTHRDGFDDHHQAILEAFRRLAPNQAGPAAAPNAAWLDEARTQLEQQYDPVNGGFGDAPKFPHPPNIERLLRGSARSRATGTGDDAALHMATHTLAAMADGGLYDQLGGGFCRYTVDGTWTIPHFEKMLYDNALLLPLYADAALATGKPRFAAIAAGTGGWVMREMQDPAGGYYSTLDADSEGEEGKYYVWTAAEIKDTLDASEWALCRQVYGLDGTPNFEGKWHLRIATPLAAAADQLGLTPAAATACLQRAHDRLLARREQRVRPARDEKILTSWNGMMIKGMAHAGRLLNEPQFIASAARAFDFVRAVLWRDGRLFATTRAGKTHLNAYLDDYVWLIDAALELLQARWREADLEFAVALADATLAHFEDRDRGGFYFTADDHEALLHRAMPAADDATPSGNGIAASALLRLGHLLGEPRYLDAAERTLRALAGHIAGFPAAHNTLLNAVEESIYPVQIVVLRGTPAAMQPWLERSARTYAPRRMVFPIPADAESLPGALAARAARGEVTAYLCIGSHCLAPFDDLDRLDAALHRPVDEN